MSKQLQIWWGSWGWALQIQCKSTHT